MSALLQLALKLLGLTNATSPAATVLGIVNQGAMIPALLWVYTHRDDLVTFTVSLGTLGAVGLVMLFWLEVNRRTQPTNGA